MYLIRRMSIWSPKFPAALVSARELEPLGLVVAAAIAGPAIDALLEQAEPVAASG